MRIHLAAADTKSVLVYWWSRSGQAGGGGGGEGAGFLFLLTRMFVLLLDHPFFNSSNSKDYYLRLRGLEDWEHPP